MQEKSDGSIRNSCPQHCRQEHQVIIVNPDHITRFIYRHYLIAKDLIRFDVMIEVLILVTCVRRKVMKQRPDGVVAESIIMFVARSCWQKDRVKCEISILKMHV